jgi:hypothetical protein
VSSNTNSPTSVMSSTTPVSHLYLPTLPPLRTL